MVDMYSYGKNNMYVDYVDPESILPADLSDEQKTFLGNLNTVLAAYEVEMCREIETMAKLGKEKVSSPDEWINDFEIEHFVTFYLRESDPDFDEDRDNILVVLCGSGKPLLFINDKSNHNEFQGWDHPMKDEHHCWLYH